jgi:hypothetical protein
MIRITMITLLIKKTNIIKINKLLKGFHIHLIPLINLMIQTINMENITKFRKKIN